MKRLALLALLLASCLPDAPSEPLVLSPTSEAMAVTSDWAARWERAAGIAIAVEDGGTPVVLADDVWVTEHAVFDHEVPGSYQACGATKTTSGRVDLIAVDRTPPASCQGGWGYALGHEIGHALSPRSRDNHSENGTLMGETHSPGVVYVVDESSLATVCAQAPCLAFNPESR